MSLTEEVLDDFRRTIEEASARLLSMTEDESRAPLADEKWSAKETIGHLIDSASNNHQRFVRAQFKDDLVFEGYAQEDWIRAQNYNEEPWPLLVGLWRHYNLHLAHVMRHAPEAARATLRAPTSCSGTRRATTATSVTSRPIERARTNRAVGTTATRSTPPVVSAGWCSTWSCGHVPAWWHGRSGSSPVIRGTTSSSSRTPT